MSTPRLPVVDWTDAPTDLNGLVRFAERRNLVSARVPSNFKRSLTRHGWPSVHTGRKHGCHLNCSRMRLKCDGTRAETRFHLSAKRTSPFKSAGGRQFSRLLAAEVCASAVVMLDTPCPEVVWRVLATHSIRQFPLHFPSRASPCAISGSNAGYTVFRGSVKSTGYPLHSPASPSSPPPPCLTVCHHISVGL